MRTLTPAEMKAVARYVDRYPCLEPLASQMHTSEQARRTLAFNIALLEPPTNMTVRDVAKACLIDT